MAQDRQLGNSDVLGESNFPPQFLPANRRPETLEVDKPRAILDEIDQISLLHRQANELAGNLYTGPHHVEVSGVLSSLTDGSDNPWLTLTRISPEDFAQRVSMNGYRASIPRLCDSYSEYQQSKDTWFEKNVAPEVKEYLSQHPIASFSLEIAVSKMPQTYAGGLGILNGDVLRQASDMGLPYIAVSLLYKHGYFIQKIGEDGRQQEYFVTQTAQEFPMANITGKDGKPLLVKIPMGDHEISAKAYEVPVGRAKLYLLDTDIDENGQEGNADRLITANLYADWDKSNTRIRQELVLGAGGKRLLNALGIEPGVVHLQEGHAAFEPLEAAAELVEKGVSPGKAIREAVAETVFTNHTIVVGDFFPEDKVEFYLAPIAKRLGIDVKKLIALGKDKEGRFSMTQLALLFSAIKNGVSEPHSEVLRELYPRFKFESVTNGVHDETWLAKKYQDLLDKSAGEAWRQDIDDVVVFEKIRDIPNGDVWEIHQESKKIFLEYVNSKYGTNLDAEVFTAALARRFASYKRNNLILRDTDRIAGIVGNDERPMQLIIGGKAPPGDDENKNVIQEVNLKLRDPRFKGRVVFLEEYDFALAKLLLSGVDLWINNPVKPLEASGTSGMKSGMNGELQLTKLDGWAAEVDWSDKGWTIGEGVQGRDDEKEAEDIYRKLEGEIIPTHYDRRDEWIRRMKNTMIHVLQHYSTRRMVTENFEKLYKSVIEQELSSQKAA